MIRLCRGVRKLLMLKACSCCITFAGNMPPRSLTMCWLPILKRLTPSREIILASQHNGQPCLCDRQAIKKRENERFLGQLALKLLTHMSRPTIMHKTQQSSATFLHILASRGRWDFLEVIMWPLWGGRFAVTQSEVSDMLNDVNGNGYACFDLSMKNDKP